MRITKSGIRIVLYDDVDEVIAAFMPAGDEFNRFLKSADYKNMLQEIIDKVQEHADAVTK